jgi:dTDP-glucose 4,6-dehydratase
VIESGKLGQTYNVGGGNQPSNIDIVKELCANLDELRPASSPYASLITYVPDRPGHDRRYAMDITRISTELGWRPRHDLASGLRETVLWYLNHMDWVETILSENDYQMWLEKNYVGRGEK